MKIALAQLNFKIGDIKNNSDKIISKIKEAQKDNVDLIIFSELAICGYDPQDWLEFKEFINKCETALNKIALHCKNITAIIGTPTTNPINKGKKIFNSAVVITNCEIIKTINKTLLPTYDIFWDYRYFEQNKNFELININGVKIGITICEDIWDEQEFSNEYLNKNPYSVNPIGELMQLNPDMIINISASPFAHDKDDSRKKTVIKKSLKYNIPFVYVNQVGANTEIIYDGGSFATNNKGEVIEQLKHFEEDYKIIDTKYFLKTSENITKEQPSIAKIHDALILGIKDYFSKLGLQKTIIGLSGGIDSAVVLVLLQRALGSKNVKSILMPSKYSSDHSISDSIKLSENIKTEYDTINIESIVDNFESSLAPAFKNCEQDVTEENLQARTRGMLLMAYSNKFGYILMNTSNKSEIAVGYSTLYGDMNGAISILGDVYKTHVYELAEYINKKEEVIPRNIITKPPSAELRPDQKDSDSLPDYDTLDAILYSFIEKQKDIKQISNDLGIDINLVSKIIKMVHRAEFKRFQTPPILKVTSKAFGTGRKIPIVSNII